MDDEIHIEGEPRKPMKAGTVTTVDMRTGEVTEVRRNAMTIMPCRPGRCPECGMDHGPDEPHDRQSLAYQYNFRATHGRWPSWSDSMRHCTPEVQATWRNVLVDYMRSEGMPIPDDLAEPNPSGR